MTGEVKALKSEVSKREAEALLLEQEKMVPPAPYLLALIPFFIIVLQQLSDQNEKLQKQVESLEEESVRAKLNASKLDKTLHPDQEAVKLLECAPSPSPFPSLCCHS